MRTLKPLPLVALGAVAVSCGVPPAPSFQAVGNPSTSRAAPPPAITSRGLPPAVDRELDRQEAVYNRLAKEAHRLFDAGRYAEAEAKVEEVDRTFAAPGSRRDSDLAHLVALIRIKQGRYRDAIRQMEASPDTNRVNRLDLALCYVRVGELDRAAAFYDPGLITGYHSAFGEGRAYLPPVGTAADLEAALRWCRGAAEAMVGRDDEAVDDYAAAFRRFPRNPLLGAVLGFEADNAQRPEQAAAAYAVVQRYGDAEMRETTRYRASITSEVAKAARARRAAKGVG